MSRKPKEDTLELPFQTAAEIVSDRIDLSLIDVPPEYESKDSLVEDDALRKSIEKSGVQQSIVVIPNEDRFTVVKGARRVRISQIVGLKDIPALVNEVPPGADPKEYRDRLRMILTQARQDLLPSQRASMLQDLMKVTGMNQTQVAEYLGVDAGSITNWVSVNRYIPEVVKAIDTNELSMHAARAFDGMTSHGQKRVWEQERDMFRDVTAGDAHKIIRSKYSPEKRPTFYVAPKQTLEKMTRKKGTRAIKPRASLSESEKKKLSRDLSLREVELQEAKDELLQLKKEITLATQPIRAILANEDLVSIIPEEMKAELDRFSEVYC